MSSKRKFVKTIQSIGQEMTNCKSACTGIYSNPKEGILPRCLFFQEREEDNKEHITIAIGMNPGMADDNERKRLKGITSYVQVNEELDGYINHDYYKRCTWLIDDLQLKGDILWTEVVKCQNEFKRRNPNIYTSSFCAGKYLFQEVKAAKACYDNVTILTIGKGVYDKMIFMFPDDKIIGVYHPRSHGYFDRLFNTS